MAKSRSKGWRTPQNDKPCAPTPALVLDFTKPAHTVFAPDVGGLLKLKAAAPMRPRKDQKPCDVGLFSDDADQLDLVSWLTEQSEH